MVLAPMRTSLQRILVTGASGFVGSALVCQLALRGGYMLRGTCQHTDAPRVDDGVEWFYGRLGPHADWMPALRDVDTVIHTAAKVHDMAGPTMALPAEYERVNVEGTVRLAQQAARSGVRRFIFISSIKVNGEITTRNKAFVAEDAVAPVDGYGRSKLECELALFAMATDYAMEIVVLRPPLLYGPSVRGNFQSLLKLVALGVPLPFKAIDNLRSLMGVGNLVDLLMVCIDHPSAANQVFLVSDGEDLSTKDLVSRIGVAMGRPVYLFPVPPWVLTAGASAIGRYGVAQRLCESLRIDTTRTQQILGWVPPIGVDEGLRRTVNAFRP